MRCLPAGYEERRRQRRRWRCCSGGVQHLPVAVHVDADGVHIDGGRRRRQCRGLRPVARTVQVPEPTQDEAASVPAARAQRERKLDHGQWPAGGPGSAQRFQVHGAGAQLQRGHRVQRRRGNGR